MKLENPVLEEEACFLAGVIATRACQGGGSMSDDTLRKALSVLTTAEMPQMADTSDARRETSQMFFNRVREILRGSQAA